MRAFNYPFEPNTAFLKNAFGHTLETIELQTGEQSLSITSEGEYYQDSLNNIFFIFEGEGVLQFQDCLKDYDFSNLYFRFLEEFLSTSNHNINANVLQKEKIKDFIEVYNKNIKKGYLYLNPPNFSKLDSLLVTGNKNL